MSLPVEKPFKLAEYKVEPRVVKKKKVAEVVKPKVEKKQEPAPPKENVTKSLVSQLKTETISIAQQAPNATQNVTSNLVKKDPENSTKQVLSEKTMIQ